MMRPELLTLGHGYSAQALTARIGAQWQLSGTTRSAEKAATMRARGVNPIDWADTNAVAAAIMRAQHILVSLPPSGSGDEVLNVHADALRASKAVWIGYLSTTGVYGDRNGAWVDETTDVRPVNQRSSWRADAEQSWLASGLPVNIFRLAGIYGPGRSALNRVREGRAKRIIKPGQVFSRIHCEDIASVLLASMEHPNPGRIYNLADDVPAPPQDVIACAAELLGVSTPPEIPFETAELSPMARSFYGESKKVSNNRIKQELGVTLRFPDYRTGLSSILASGG